MYVIPLYTNQVTSETMEERGPPEELPDVLQAAMAADGEALAAELGLLEAMPQVRLLPSGIFDRAKPVGSRAQLRGVLIALRCCGGQLDQKCNDYGTENPKACPSHVEAARILRAKVELKHGSAECQAKAHEALAAEAADAASSSTPPAARTVAHLMANQFAIQNAHRQLKAAQQQLDQSVEAERIASEARAAASAALEEVCSLANLPTLLPARPPARPPDRATAQPPDHSCIAHLL